MPAQAGSSRSSTRSRMVFSPMRISALSPPPMRRASPPASTRPKVDGPAASVVMHRRLAPVLHALVVDVAKVLVEHDTVLARQGDEAFSARAADQGQTGLAGEVDPPGGEARARHADGESQSERL